MLLDRQTSLLLIVDIQEKFVAALHGYGGMLKNGILLMGAAARLRIPMLMSEQYPQGTEEFRELSKLVR